jgi:hypothetical protein
MSYQEKRTIISLIGTILISVFYFVYVFQSHPEWSLSMTNDFGFWGAFILILIPVQIGFKIIIHIVFVIINKIATNEDEPSFSDELDTLISLKTTRNFYFTFQIGFLLSMGTLVIDMPPFVMFMLLTLSLIMAAIIGDISQLYFYRRGVSVG